MRTSRVIILGLLWAAIALSVPSLASAAVAPSQSTGTATSSSSVGLGASIPPEDANTAVPGAGETTTTGATANNGTQVNGEIRLKLNFDGAPLKAVLQYLSEKAGLSIVSIENLDTQVTVMSLQPLSVDATIQLLNSVLNQNGFAAVRTGKVIKVVPLSRAPRELIPVREISDPNLIDADDTVMTNVIPIRYLGVRNLVENLQTLLPESASLTANEDGNSLILTATNAEVKRILQVIRALDTHLAGVSDVRVYHLKNADARQVADMINRVFQQQQTGGTGRGNQRGGGMMDIMSMMGGGGRGGRGAMTMPGMTGTGTAVGVGRGIAVTAASDDRTNSVVVRGPVDLLDVIGEVVRTLDSTTAEISDVKVFKLRYADAENTARLINEIFGNSASRTRTTTGRGGTTSPIQFTTTGGRGGRGGQTGATGTTSTVAVIASADVRTNSVVVTGPPEVLVVVKQVIDELDANPEQERQIFVYALKNASAQNVMTIMNSIFTQLRTMNAAGVRGATQTNVRGGGTGSRGGATTAAAGGTGSTATSTGASAEDLSEDTYFQADPNTNSVLILTSTKNYEKVKPIIAELDKSVGQVLIKVLFAEVTHTNSVDFGTEFSMLNLRDDTTRFTTDTTPFTPLTARTTTDTVFGGPQFGTGLSVRTIQGDIDITLRALQERGRLNVLSRPYVLARNNQAATISVGQEVPYATGTTTVAGQTQSTTAYRNVAITLTVTPTINPEGLVNMTVAPTISSFTGDSLPISADLSLPIFATRSATTKVAVRDGQTIVIGGLIQDSLKETITKVPVVGSLPVVGHLFGRTIKEKDKTELLIFLTPRVAQQPEGLTPISDFERRGTNIDKDKMSASIFRRHMDAMENTDPNATVPKSRSGL